MARRAGRWVTGVALVAAMATVVAGCFDVQSADLFLLTRTGQGSRLTLLVSDSGAVSCDGARAKPISNTRLIQARDLSDNLAKDAAAKLTIPPAPGSVYYFRVKLQQGTVSFPDRAADSRHPILAQLELFALQTAQQACGSSR